MKFINKNGYVEESRFAFIWCLLFGSLYFMAKGIWTHAIISFILAILTMGISWFFYPFVAENIVYNHYIKNGWKEVKDN